MMKRVMMCGVRWLGRLAVWLGAALNVSAADVATEARAYPIFSLPIPAGVILEAGALQWMPDGQLAVSTRLGEIYLVEHPLDPDPARIRFKLYASGLHEVLGLALKDGVLYATQRCEVTRLRDTDGDSRADVFETVSDGWGMTGDYHEYAFGSKFDAEGYLWVALCLTGSFTSEAPYRGWCLRIAPDGRAVPTVSGLRSPGGIGTNALGDMFYTDNQGPWNGACSLKHLHPGGFVGNPSGNNWYASATAMGPRPAMPKSGSRMHVEAERIPELIPPAVLFPYNRMGQSASGIATDASGGKFGPFAGQMFVGDQTHSTVMRVYLEKVNGRYQGACFPFLQGFGSGSLSLEMTADGVLFVGGTDRGWGARGGKPFALERVHWTGVVPFEILEMRARPDGFELVMTEPVEAASAKQLSSYTLETYTYIYQSSYGSPEVDPSRPVVKDAAVSDDGRRVRLRVDGLKVGHVHQLRVPGLRSGSGQPVLHPIGYYTLNAIPAE
jgi:glucose/arabinose dehydrogenase